MKGCDGEGLDVEGFGNKTDHVSGSGEGAIKQSCWAGEVQEVVFLSTI